MLLFGHPYIPFTPFYHITESSDVDGTPPNSTLFVTFDIENLDLITFLNQHQLPFALEVKSLEEVVFAHNLNAKYIVVQDHLAKSAQNCAETYLFDAKILCRMENEASIEEKIIEGVDGLIYAQAIVKISL